jgi:hypothetical protein
MTEQHSTENNLENKIIELEKKLNELLLVKSTEQIQPQKKNKTPQYIIDANKRYYHKKKNNLDFKIKIRDRNRKAREKTKPSIDKEGNARKTVGFSTTSSIEVITNVNNDPIIKKISNPITISFYEDDDIGF